MHIQNYVFKAMNGNEAVKLKYLPQNKRCSRGAVKTYI